MKTSGVAKNEANQKEVSVFVPDACEETYSMCSFCIVRFVPVTVQCCFFFSTYVANVERYSKMTRRRLMNRDRVKEASGV